MNPDNLAFFIEDAGINTANLVVMVGVVAINSSPFSRSIHNTAHLRIEVREIYVRPGICR